MAKRKCNRCNVAKSKDEYYNREGTCKECRKQRKKELYHGKISDNEDEENLDCTMELDDIVQNLEIRLRGEMSAIVAVLRKDTANLECTIERMLEKIGLISDENTILHEKVGKLEIQNAKLHSIAETNQHSMDCINENMLRNVSTLHEKVGKLDMEIIELHSIVETNQHRMDCMDDNILRNMSILHEKVGKLEIDNTKLHSIAETNQYRMDSMDENILQNVSLSEDLCIKTRELDVLVKGIHRLQNKIGKMLLEVGNTYYQFIMGNSTKYDVRKRLNDVGYLETRKMG